ncbi:MAG: hypothetical protein NVS3B28_30230 [Candidatus Velthaea sp.]
MLLRARKIDDGLDAFAGHAERDGEFDVTAAARTISAQKSSRHLLRFQRRPAWGKQAQMLHLAGGYLTDVPNFSGERFGQ